VPSGAAMQKISAGIDLGTTNSCLAVLGADGPVVIPNDLGEPITPSIVAVLSEGVIVGKKARSRLLTHPTQTFASIKRRMGERYARTVLGREYTPEAVSALILAHLKECGERHLGRPLDDVVITVPANFNSVQRQATKDAGEIAGLNVLRVFNEPTAAALAYGHQHQLSAVLVVFDLGGGTFDISAVEVGDNLFEVIHSAGDNHLGGDDFNLRIVNWIVEEFEKQTGFDIRRETFALSLVHEWARAAKHALSDAPEVRVQIDNLYRDRSFSASLTRQAFEEMCRDLFSRLQSIAWNVSEHLRQPKYQQEYPGVFDNQLEGCDILLVGGETRVPAVRRLVQTIFKGRIHADVNPDEVVAMGAALQAGILHQQSPVKEIVLVDTTALSLGTAVAGGIFSRLIEANTRIPCTRSHEYVPLDDYQPVVVYGIYQGESDLCANNIKVGEFEFRLDPPRLREQGVMLLTFHLDADDILHVSAVDKLTRATQTVTIKDSQNLDRDAVERLRREAKLSRHEEQEQVRRLQRRLQLRQRVMDIIRLLDSLANGATAQADIQQARDFAAQFFRALAGEDDDLLERSAHDLEVAWEKIRELVPEQEHPQADRVAIPDPGMVSCANCGARLPKGYAFCGKCGVPLKKDACSACGAALVEGFQFCGKCGARIE
jgi:molecular chaperone DnaK